MNTDKFIEVEEKSRDSMSLPAYSHSVRASSEFEAEPKYDNAHYTNSNPSETPLLDAYLRKPSNKDKIQIIAQALTNIVNEEKSTKSNIEASVRAIGDLAADAKKAKKEATKEERKAMKNEVKTMMKGMKGDLKKAWRESKEKN